MNEQDILEQYRQIESLLRQKRLKEAIAQTQAFGTEHLDWTLNERLEKVQTSYRYMLQYMRMGVKDPQRPVLYQQLLTEMWEIADQIRLKRCDSISESYYHQLRRSGKSACKTCRMTELLHQLEAFPDDVAVCRLMPDNREPLHALLLTHEENNRRLFLSVWTNSSWSVSEMAEATDFLHSESLAPKDLCLMVSAVMLSVLNCFDARKMRWLFDAYGHADREVSQRALVSLALLLQRYADRFALYPDLMALLQLQADAGLGVKLNRVYIKLLLSQETEKVDKKMREEIIPEMIKNANLMKNGPLFLDEGAGGEENDSNPEWKKILDNSVLEERLREMADLQVEGSDIYMGTFAQLKYWPFFKELPNWFYPFDELHSSVVDMFDVEHSSRQTILSMMMRVGTICNSDKYSFCFMLTKLPEEQRTHLMRQLSEQESSDLLDKEYKAGWHEKEKWADFLTNQYIHDLYRFFKLNPRRNEFPDLFSEEIALHLLAPLQSLFNSPQQLADLADFHFRKEHTREAIEVYQRLVNLNHADAELYQKMGFCFQKEKRYAEAVDAYRKADILMPDQRWTLRHLATCYRLSKEYALALECYQRVEAMQTENRQLAFYIGSCLVGLERYEEALNYFFKLDYLEEESLKAGRAIAWCSFLCGKLEQAAKYYERVLANQPASVDYLNAAHVVWCMGNQEQAVALYTQAAADFESGEQFRELFLQDKQILLKQGVAERDIPLILDLCMFPDNP